MIKSIFKGMIIGIANIVPGVSGGTLAISMGIYDKLIYAITHLFKDFKKCFKILLPIAIGAAIGIVGLSFLIEYMFDKIPFQTNLLFIGLILGGVPTIYSKVSHNKIKVHHIILFLLFFIAILSMSFLGEGKEEAVVITFSTISILKLFGIGIIASATMVVPGVSGSMILILMGYYTPIISTINSFIKNFLQFDISGMLDNLKLLVPFGLGIVIGIFAIAKIIELLFEKFEGEVYWAIIGLIFASILSIIISLDYSQINVLTIITGIITFIAGFYAARKLE